ncbi:Non-specific lipid-transfer protein 1-like protein [Drosera capensis]
MAVGSSILFKLVAVAVAYMVVSAPYVAGIECKQVETGLLSCLPYLIAETSDPSEGCCKGVKTINMAATTKDLRKGVCNCLKSFLTKYPEVKDKNAGDLAGKCHADLPYKVSSWPALLYKRFSCFPL